MLDVFFPAGRDLAAWADRHGRGEAPGLWPYGLEQLRAFDPDAQALSLAKPTRFEALLSRILRRRPSLGAALEGERIGITWDENAGRQMTLTSPRERMYTGVIWVTDLVRRGRDTGRMREILRGMDGLWVISRGQVEPLIDFVGEDGPPVGYFRFGVDADFFRLEPYPVAPVVVSVGGDRDRDASTLFEAMREVRAARPDAEIVLQSTSDVTPPDGVTVVPHLSHVELRALYARASVVAIATRDNLHASGMTVSLEAQATGRPVVMTATPGIEDYVDNGSTGVLVPVGDSEAVAAGVVRFLDDPERAERFGRAGRRTVEEGMTTGHLSTSLAAFVGLGDRVTTR